VSGAPIAVKNAPGAIQVTYTLSHMVELDNNFPFRTAKYCSRQQLFRCYYIALNRKIFGLMQHIIAYNINIMKNGFVLFGFLLFHLQYIATVRTFTEHRAERFLHTWQ